MERKECGLLDSLRNLVIFTKYFGVHSLNYKSDSNVKEFVTSKNLKISKMLWFIIVVTFNLYVSRLVTQTIPQNIFIIHIGYTIYLDLYLMILFSIVISDFIYEETMRDILNNLIKLQKLLQETDKIKIRRLTIFIIIFTNFFIHILGVYAFSKQDEFTWDAILITFNFMYISFIENVTEYRFSLMFLILPVYFQHLCRKFETCETKIKCNKIIKTHQELCWLARKINKTFSVPLLFIMGYYLSNIVISVIQNYCQIVFFNKPVNIFEMFQLAMIIVKLCSLIIVVNNCMVQVTWFKSNCFFDH